jgi:hypothetical protein
MVHRFNVAASLKGSDTARGARLFRQKFTLEDAIGSRECSLEANIRVTNGIPLGCPLLLPVGTVNCIQTLKVVALPAVHDRICRLLRVWVVTGLTDFIQNPSLLEGLKKFMLTLESAGGMHVALILLTSADLIAALHSQTVSL